MSSSIARGDRGEPARIDAGVRPGAGELAATDAGDPALLRALSDPATYRGATPVTVHETHASWVFVSDGRAYKVKKPVALGFLDYRTLALRRAACEEEVRVNAELAPDVYLGVCAIVSGGEGFELSREHDPDAVEYAVEMRSFDESDSLAGLIAAGTLERGHLDAVASRLAEFHRDAPVVEGGGPGEVTEMWEKNLAELAGLSNLAELAGLSRELGWGVDSALRFGGAFVAAHRGEIEERRRAGLVRDGHGDLRCEHVLVNGGVRVVDRIEFDPALRHIDVGCDLAFLTMDLEACGAGWAAEELLAAYRRHGLDPGSDQLLCFYAAHHAFVRAKVGLIAAGERCGAGRAGGAGRTDVNERSARARGDAVRTMWCLGERLCWRARAPLALVLCGPAASGKSVLAEELARRSGFEIVSSDAIRKGAAGLAAGERGGAELYGQEVTRATYERLGAEAERALAGGRGVILDATCRSRAHRGLLFERLSASGAPFLAVRCTVALAVALERAARRMGEAGHVSDATPEIVAEQFSAFEALDELSADEVVRCDTVRPPGDQLEEVCRALDGVLEASAR